MKILQVCPPHLSDVATVPWEIQKSHFQQPRSTSVPKTSTFYFLNNCVKKYPILMIFGTLNPEKN